MRIPGFEVKKKIGGTIRRVLDTSSAAFHAVFPIGRGYESGYLDHLQADSSGLMCIEGWCREPVAVEQYPRLLRDGQSVPVLRHFRFSRADVQALALPAPLQTGVAWEFLLENGAAGLALELKLPDGTSLPINVPFAISRPHYDALYFTEEVLHRDHIYGSGPPNGTVHPDVLDLATKLPGPVLDFGCGRGTLVAQLRAEGIEADGLELNSPILREAIAPELSPHIILYDGTLPSPYADESYRSVVCSEVLEHIPDYQGAVADIARIAQEQALITVPDAGAIPTGHRHGVVPWHLLEGSHLNFFSQASLEKTLRPYFRRIEFGRAGSWQLNDTSFYVSLTAQCWK